MPRLQRVIWGVALVLAACGLPAGAAPKVAESGVLVTVEGQGYRAVFTRDRATVQLAVQSAAGDWVELAAKGTSADLGVFAGGVPSLANGSRCGWRLDQAADVATVTWNAPLDLDGRLCMQVVFLCTDEGVLIGGQARHTSGEPPAGSLWFPARLTLDPAAWNSYAFFDGAGKQHTGTLGGLDPCPAYAGVTTWGSTGDVVKALSDSRPALIVRDTTSGTGFGFVYVNRRDAWAGSGTFLQRHTPEHVYLYGGLSQASASRWRWAWLASFPVGQAAVERIDRLMADAKRRLGNFAADIPALPKTLSSVPDFPAALRRASPTADIKQAVVYTMNETTSSDYAMGLIRKTGPDLAIRGWFKWNRRPPVETWSRFPQEAHRLGARFGGGITCSALYEGENGITHEQLLDMATRAPDGSLVDAWGTPGVRHGSLSSPAYLDYLFRWCSEQIDAGVDYLFMDETTAALSQNEGYDDHSLRDFLRFLTDVCPRTRDWANDDPRWQTELGVALDNPTVCPNGQIDSLDYRSHLRLGGWLAAPTRGDNPLASLWLQFREWRDDRAWKELTDRIRDYAGKQGRKVLISGNGLVRYVDLQVLGVWGNWSLQGGHIDLRRNEIQTWRSLVTRGRELAGAEVPVVLFHDWGFGDPPFPWLAAPPSEREVWMRTRGAEIYAAGAFFAFPVLGPFGCDANRDGTLGTIAQQTVFYQTHRELYSGSRWAGCEGLEAGDRPVSLAAWWHGGSSSVAVHVINRDVRDGVLQAVSAPINLRVPIAAVPDRATLISPDFSGEKPLAVSQVGDYLTVTLPGLEAYSVVLLHYGQKPSLDRLTDPVRLRPVARWARPATAEFRVRGDGCVAHGEDLSGFLQGMLHTELRNPPVFLLNSRTPGEFRVHVRAVASAGARLSVRIDNGPATLIDLPDRDGKNDGRAAEYDRTFAFPVPAGAHRIALGNTGPDWLTLEWLEFTGTFDD